MYLILEPNASKYPFVFIWRSESVFLAQNRMEVIVYSLNNVQFY